MLIEINNSTKIDIKEDWLVVKDGKLYNATTKKYEGIDGDIISFLNGNMITKGTVDGYTCNDKIKLRGIDKTYKGVKDIRIEHMSIVTNSEEDELFLAENA